MTRNGRRSSLFDRVLSKGAEVDGGHVVSLGEDLEVDTDESIDINTEGVYDSPSAGNALSM